MDNKDFNCIIVHGCPADKESAIDFKTRTYDKHWIPWVKETLIGEGIKTELALMPSPWAPVYEDFKKEFEKYPVSENTVLVGHSCGTAFLVRWLGDTKQKIKKLILVAPWKITTKEDEFRPAFYDYPIDETIKSRVGEIVMFTADNEEENGKKSLEMYREVLGGRVIELKGRGHYIFRDMGVEEFPELIEEITNQE